MADKILVTTDLSKNSAAGIKFGIQLASQHKAMLIFYLMLDLQKPTRWSSDQFKRYRETEIDLATRSLNKFVEDIYRKSGGRVGKYQCVVEEGSAVGESILEYASASKVNFICIGTQGAGTFRRLLGTHTSYVLSNSPIPVFVVPKGYRSEKISQMLYASDLSDLKYELKRVTRFASGLKAKVAVLHYDYLYDVKETRDRLSAIAKKHQESGVVFHFQKLNIDVTLDNHLKKAVKKFKPSLVVLFTNQHRDWYERLFLSSKSAEVSFDTTKPLLIFGKRSGK